MCTQKHVTVCGTLRQTRVLYLEIHSTSEVHTVQIRLWSYLGTYNRESQNLTGLGIYKESPYLPIMTQQLRNQLLCQGWC